MADPELIFYAETPQQAMEAAVIAVLEAESIVGEYYWTSDRRWWKGKLSLAEVQSFIRKLEELIDTAQAWTWGESSSPIETIGPYVKWTNVRPQVVGWSRVGEEK